MTYQQMYEQPVYGLRKQIEEISGLVRAGHITSTEQANLRLRRYIDRMIVSGRLGDQPVNWREAVSRWASWQLLQIADVITSWAIQVADHGRVQRRGVI